MHMACLSMFDDIVQGFLNDAEDRDLHGTMELFFLAMYIHVDANGRMFLNSAGIPAQGGRQAQIVEMRWT
jgi:hypothetical protein